MNIYHLENVKKLPRPSLSLVNMKEEIFHAGFHIVEVIYPETKVARQQAYIIVAEKNEN